MKRRARYFLGAALAVPALGAAIIVGRALAAAPPPQPPVLDFAKRKIELRTTELLGAAPAAKAPPAGNDGFVNPKVAPGKVRWHPDFASACKAAARSGKPVLLFQMMGRLDERFC